MLTNHLVKKQILFPEIIIHIQNTDCSMDQLARLSGVNEEVLSAMINGEREITPNMLARILDVYNYFGEEDLLFNQMVC